jgi:hypothetical protein
VCSAYQRGEVVELVDVRTSMSAMSPRSTAAVTAAVRLLTLSFA